MRRVILMMVLAAVSSSAMAEWLKGAYDDKLTMYVDASTIRRNGEIVEAWMLTDYKTATKDKETPNKSRNKCRVDLS